MDKNEAKLLLASYRPNGSDISDERFEEALQLTLVDQELGQWFAESRKFDTIFSQSLELLDIPRCLKDKIIQSEVFEEDIERSHEDCIFMASLANIQPPKDLKHTILSSVTTQEKEQEIQTPPKKKRIKFVKFLYPLSIAAVVTFSVYLGGLMSQPMATPKVAVKSNSLLTDLDRFFQVGGFNSSYNPQGYLQNASLEYNEKTPLPTPSQLPSYLQNQTIIGCKPLLVDGKAAKLMCFDSKDHGVLHLVVYNANHAHHNTPLPSLDKVKGACKKCCKTGFSVAKWKDQDCVCILFSRSLDVEKLESVF